jgi:hypothetical protein
MSNVALFNLSIYKSYFNIERFRFDSHYCYHYPLCITGSDRIWLIEYMKRIWLFDSPLMVAVVEGKSEPLY